MNKIGNSKLAKKGLAVLMGGVMLASVGVPALLQGGFTASAASGKFTLDYSSFEEAKKAAGELNIRLSEEGSVLLKNDGTLPLTGKETVSVFGQWEDQLQNNNQVSDSISTAFAKAGFKVNPALADFYRSNNKSDAAVHVEPLNFSQKIVNSFDLYNELAIIVVGRSGAEMNDLDTVIKEEEKETYLGEDQGWEHKDLFDGSDDDYLNQEKEGSRKYKHKHELELSDSEQDLVKYVESQGFKHIVFVINSSSAMETYNIEHDKKINAVIWIGRTGEQGIHALPRIINGLVTPSGKVSDEWYKDFTADPIWQNFGTLTQQFGFEATGVKYTDILTGNSGSATQYPNNYMYPDGTYTSDLTAPRYNGFNGTDWEEDIYIGYKYVETYYQDIYNGKQAIPDGYKQLSQEQAAKAWYEDTVTHPFGQGLSYTDFSMNIKGVYVDAAGKTPLEDALENPDDFGSSKADSVLNTQKYKKLYVEVEVQNIGARYSGKEVVQIYVNAPYIEGQIEKPAMRLVGFEKTETLAPGAKQTLTVEVDVQDMASYDYSDANKNQKMAYELDLGDYVLYASNSSHVDLSTIGSNEKDAQDSYDFNLSKTVVQELDDFSDNVISNKFSDSLLNKKDTQYNSIRNDTLNDSSFKFNNGGDAAMTQMTRSDAKGGFASTFPAPPTKADMTLSEEFVEDILGTARFDADRIVDDNGTPMHKEEEWNVESIPENWTQAENAPEGLNKYLLADMAGIDPEGTTPLTAEDTNVEDFVGKTGKEAWELFMNQLTWTELKKLVEEDSFQTPEIPSINKPQGSDQDRPNMLGQTYNWCDEVVIASTFNKDLAKQEGIITANMGILYGYTGWYGPGMNIHRSAFLGRNNDYYSQDGIHAGLMAAAVVSGAQSRGLMCFIKHFAFNEAEVTRNGWVHFIWASEQTLRENSLQAFQKPMQEGGALGAMSGFARVAGEACNISYRLLTGIARQEWGYKGTFITDAEPGSKATASTDLMIRAGNDMMLRNNHNTDSYNRWEVSGTWNPALRNGKGGVEVGGAESKDHPYKEHKYIKGGDYAATCVNKTVESVNQYYYVRTCAQRVLYITANSNMSKNGVVLSGWTGTKDTNVSRGASANVDASVPVENLAGSTDVVYEITEGALPDGLTLNASTGKIEGVVTGAPGTYDFTVSCTVDGWIKGTADFSVTVGESFTLEEEAPAKVGEEYYATVEQEVLTTENGYDAEVTYAIVSGALPEGLELDSTGAIEGTPTTAGSYTFTVRVIATKTVGSGFFAQKVTYNFDTEYTIEVAGEGSATPEVPLTETRVKELIENALASLEIPASGMTKEQVQAIVDEALEGVNSGMTEEQVKTLINQALENFEPKTEGGCGGIIGTTGAIVAAITLLGAGALVLRKKKD